MPLVDLDTLCKIFEIEAPVCRKLKKAPGLPGGFFSPKIYETIIIEDLNSYHRELSQSIQLMVIAQQTENNDKSFFWIKTICSFGEAGYLHLSKKFMPSKLSMDALAMRAYLLYLIYTADRSGPLEDIALHASSIKTAIEKEIKDLKKSIKKSIEIINFEKNTLKENEKECKLQMDYATPLENEILLEEFQEEQDLSYKKQAMYQAKIERYQRNLCYLNASDELLDDSLPVEKRTLELKAYLQEKVFKGANRSIFYNHTSPIVFDHLPIFLQPDFGRKRIQSAFEKHIPKTPAQNPAKLSLTDPSLESVDHPSDCGTATRRFQY